MLMIFSNCSYRQYFSQRWFCVLLCRVSNEWVVVAYYAYWLCRDVNGWNLLVSHLAAAAAHRRMANRQYLCWFLPATESVRCVHWGANTAHQPARARTQVTTYLCAQSRPSETALLMLSTHNEWQTENHFLPVVYTCLKPTGFVGRIRQCVNCKQVDVKYSKDRYCTLLRKLRLL